MSLCRIYNGNDEAPENCWLNTGHPGPHSWETEAASPPWWEDHRNLALVAEFMNRQEHSFADILYMLEKPWKHGDDYNLAQAETTLPPPPDVNR